MNYTESFDQFASKLGPTDLALYAGAGIVLWVLFKDKLSPVQEFIVNMFKKKNDQPVADRSFIPTDNILSNVFSTSNKKIDYGSSHNKDVFFDLVVSWKQTRDLAVKSGCNKAVEVADQMFPFLSPSVCLKENVNE